MSDQLPDPPTTQELTEMVRPLAITIGAATAEILWNRLLPALVGMALLSGCARATSEGGRAAPPAGGLPGRLPSPGGGGFGGS